MSNETGSSREKILIRDVAPEDRDYIIELNETNVEVLSPMDEEKYQFFIENSDMYKVAEVDGDTAAFLITLREGRPYRTSENYTWFMNNYDRFAYVDRIVIDEKYRHMGIGRMLYEMTFDKAREDGVPIVTAEIDIIPYNEPSLKFHESMGFEEVGQQVIRGGEIKVSLQVRKI